MSGDASERPAIANLQLPEDDAWFRWTRAYRELNEALGVPSAGQDHGSHRTITLEEAPEALPRIIAGGARGKTTVRIWP